MNISTQYSIYMINMLTILISFAPLCAMPKGTVNFCHKAKYLLFIVSASFICFYAYQGFLLFGMLVFSLGFFSAVWHRIVWWYRYKLTSRVVCWHRYTWPLYREFIYEHVNVAWIIFILLFVGMLTFGNVAFADETPQPPPAAEPLVNPNDEEVPKQPRLGHHNTVSIDCNTLLGKGAVRFWFNDERYTIPVECP